MIQNYILLHSYISALGSHQRGFLQHHMGTNVETTARYFWKRESKWDVTISSSPWISGKLCKRRQKSIRDRGRTDARRARPSESITKADTKRDWSSKHRPTWGCTRSSVYVIAFKLSTLTRLLSIRRSGSLTRVPALEALFLLLDFLVQPQCDGFRLIFYFFMFRCYLLEASSFLVRDRKEVGPEEREAGE